MKLVFATNNKHKLDEVRAILGNRIEVLSLNDIDCHDDIPETADTLEGNAIIKARYIHEKFGVDCFADDTGLEVEALGGEPGVYSARYAGKECDSEANMLKLLHNLKEKNRQLEEEYNKYAITCFKQRKQIKEDIKLNNGIISNPNCSTIQAVLPIKALDDKYNVKRIILILQ